MCAAVLDARRGRSAGEAGRYGQRAPEGLVDHEFGVQLLVEEPLQIDADAEVIGQ